MAKKFKITEAQYNQILAEGVAIQGATDATGKADVAKTAQAMSASGVDPKKVSVEFSGDSMTSGGDSGSGTTTQTVTEHRLITKKELQANRLRYLKENSEVLSFNNFMKNLH
jgi:hypothetical protein